jgi:hypothetical protein
METPMTYPKGTTKEQWDQYHIDVKNHEKFIEDYKFFLNRITRHLEWMKPNNTWTTRDILVAISDEIDRSHSMDAPNKPGYYRANND